MTGEAQFKQFADANYGALVPPWGPSMWEVDALDSLLYYARLPGATPEVAKSIRERLLTNLSRASQAFQSLSCASGSLSRADEGLHVGQQQGKGHAGKVVPIGGPAQHGSKAVRDLARRGAGIRALSPWRESARPRLSDEHGPGRRQPFGGDDVSCLVCPWHALATGDRAASGPTAGLSGRRAQSAILDRFMLQRACPGRPATAATVRRRSRCASAISSRRWSSRRPSRIFSTMTRGQRTHGRSRSLRCTTSPTMSGCLPPLPAEVTAARATKGTAGHSTTRLA